MAFERDLGYLDKFFDNLEAHASTLSGESGSRLKTLVGEERQRWREIRGLLGGGAPSATKPQKPDVGEKRAAPALDTAVTAGAPSGTRGDVTATATKAPSSGFTVGSLRGR